MRETIARLKAQHKKDLMLDTRDMVSLEQENELLKATIVCQAIRITKLNDDIDEMNEEAKWKEANKS